MAWRTRGGVLASRPHQRCQICHHSALLSRLRYIVPPAKPSRTGRAVRRRHRERGESYTAFRSLRVRSDPDRFEVSVWDIGPYSYCMMVFGPVIGPAVFWTWGAVPTAFVVGLAAVAIHCCRQAVVVESAGTWGVHRIFGVVVSRVPLGVQPLVKDGFVWGWSEIAIFPTSNELRLPLHDRERWVLLEWSDGGDDCARTRRADLEAAAVADQIRSAIERLQCGTSGERPDGDSWICL